MIAVMSDIHGNKIALENCLHFLSSQSISDIYFLGDATGYLPWTADVLRLLKEHHVICIKGNHDAMLLGELPLDSTKDEVYHIQATRETLKHEQLQYMRSWKQELQVIVGKYNLHMVHGAPNNPLLTYVYPDSALDTIGIRPNTDLLLMGHTHRPFIRTFEQCRVINIGSVGLPRDHGGLSCILLFEPSSGEAQLIRIPMDVDQIILEARSDLHPATRACLQRTTSDYIGTKLN